MMRKITLTLYFCLSIIVGVFAQKQPSKLYWFIPDGVRAEPDLFDLFGWAEQGYLPNIKKMMENGTYGYSKPMFPTHSPVNFAALLSGCTPAVNGVADGTMHTEGVPLSKISLGGFRSTARHVPAIWSLMEDAGKSTFMLSIPGSTPPDADNSRVVRGRRGDWGLETYALIFESQTTQINSAQAQRAKMLYQDVKLARSVAKVPPTGWEAMKKKSFSPPFEANLSAYGATLYAYVYDATNDKKINYDHVLFSTDKKKVLADLSEGGWGSWTNCMLTYGGDELSSAFMPHVIKLDADGFFRIRVLFNNINETLTQPSEMAAELTNVLGPMTDYPDNSPAQLIFHDQDKSTFQREMKMSFDWHQKAVGTVMKMYKPDVMIHDIFSPNQMLTSRWWTGYVDPQGTMYTQVENAKREQLWSEVKSMYLSIDSMVGEILLNTDSNTLVVFSSDHGIATYNHSVNVNNLLARNGYLKFRVDSTSGIPTIDWAASKAVFLKSDGIYINPDGFAGNRKRVTGIEYEKLRAEIKSLLLGLEYEGVHPVTAVVGWENAERDLQLPADRVGDLIIANHIGYGFEEDINQSLNIFSTPLTTGTKQSILVNENVKALWTPFIIMGKGVKHGVKLPENINHIDQLPTILFLMGVEIPAYVQGKVIKAAIE